MKNSLVLLIVFLLGKWLSAETIKNIGTTHYGSRELPFGMWYQYERSATLLTKTEIGGFCFITSLGWEVQAANQETCPAKIYLKMTPLTSLSAGTWASMIDGATLVYDASTSFPVSGWQSVDISDFTYYSTVSSTNLLVLCETNYGGNPPNYPWFWYSLTGTVKKHEFWRSNSGPPADNGTTDYLRPNIQVAYLPVSSHNPPSGFMATPYGTSQVDLSWSKNSAGDNVMVAFSTASTFGTPSGTYIPGDTIPGGGTVIFNGSGTTFSQVSGLSPGTTYYYIAWSVYSSPPSYSSGVTASATTNCETNASFPYTADFETENFPPSCWSLAGKTWTRFAFASGYGDGDVSAKAAFSTIAVGNFDLISPTLNISGLTGPAISFNHAYATNVNEVDKLELWTSTDNGGTYTLLYTWLGGLTGPLNTGGAISGDFIPAANQWATKSHSLPAFTNKVKFRGVSAYGNNLYIDNITFYDTLAAVTSVTWNGNISSAWNNSLNWTPNVVPNEFQTVTIPSGVLHNPSVNVTGLTCKTLTINSGASLNINNSCGINVFGDMTILSGATFHNLGSLTVSGTLHILN